MRIGSIVLPVSWILFGSSARAFSSYATYGGRGGRPSTSGLSMSAALIVQNKGGGHGELGYQLAKTLSSISKITSITLLQDDTCKYSQEPFRSYATDLPNVRVINAPLGDDDIIKEQLQTLLGGARFDYVWDNASKDAKKGAGKALCDCAKDWDVKLHTYVSSAGMYQPSPNGPFPMPETTPVKASAGQNQYEQYAAQLGLPLVSFRPQYIYGPKANKHDYLDYYFDRLVRGLPIPIPGDGRQLVSLTCSEDVASLLAAPLNNEPAAIEQRFFNCGTDQLVSYIDVAYLCARAANIPPEQVGIVLFDADRLGTTGDFPFRATNFYISPDQAKSKLGWPGPAHSLEQDLDGYFQDYLARGGPSKKISLIKDWEIVVGNQTPMPEYVASIYERFDPIIFDTSDVQKSI